MNNMNIFSNFLCKHKESDVICWHWTHGPNGNEIRFLEIQRKCKNCGKIFYRYIKNRDECEKFTKKYADKRWSIVCKPIIPSYEAKGFTVYRK